MVLSAIIVLFFLAANILSSVPPPDLQCWEADDSLTNPKIKSYENVKKISGGGLNRRRLVAQRNMDDSVETLTGGGGQRRLQSATFEILCILSETDVRADLKFISVCCPIRICLIITQLLNVLL